MALPFMPLYVADYLGDTQHLTCEQHGAYLKLLMCLWRSDGRLPDDRLKIARMVGVTAARWDRISGDVMAFFEHGDGQFWSRRLDRELMRNIKTLDEKMSSADSVRRTKVRKSLKSALQISEPEPEPDSIDLFEEKESVVGASLGLFQAADLIWAETPTASRKRSSKAQLAKALQAAINRGKNLRVIRQAVEGYFADPDKSKEAHKYAKGVHRVVQDDYWETWAPTEVVEHIDPALRDRIDRQMMEGWILKPAEWNQAIRGPGPDQSGCRIPISVMAEYGYSPGAIVTPEMRSFAQRSEWRRYR